MYEKDFPQTNATIATLQVNQLVFSYLSVAIREFPIITYCHLLLEAYDSCETTFYIILIPKTYDTSRFNQTLLR